MRVEDTVTKLVAIVEGKFGRETRGREKLGFCREVLEEQIGNFFGSGWSGGVGLLVGVWFNDDQVMGIFHID